MFIILFLLICQSLNAMEHEFAALSLNSDDSITLIAHENMHITINKQAACLSESLKKIIDENETKNLWNRRIECTNLEHCGLYPITQILEAINSVIKNKDKKNLYADLNAYEELKKTDQMTVLRWYNIIKPHLDISSENRKEFFRASKILKLPLIEKFIEINRKEAVNNRPLLIQECMRLKDVWKNNILPYIRADEKMHKAMNVAMKSIPIDFKKIMSLKVPKNIKCLACSFDGQFISIATNNNEIEVWDSKEQELIFKIFSNEFKNLYSIQWLAGNTFTIKDHFFNEHTCDMRGICISAKKSLGICWNKLSEESKLEPISPDGKYKMVINPDVKSIVIQDQKNLKFISPFIAHNNEITAVCWSSDSKYVLSTSKDAIKIANIFGEFMVWSKPFNKSVAWSQDGNTLIFGECDILSFWDTSLFKKVSDYLHAKATYQELMLLKLIADERYLPILNRTQQKVFNEFALNEDQKMREQIKGIIASDSFEIIQ